MAWPHGGTSITSLRFVKHNIIQIKRCRFYINLTMTYNLYFVIIILKKNISVIIGIAAYSKKLLTAGH